MVSLYAINPVGSSIPLISSAFGMADQNATVANDGVNTFLTSLATNALIATVVLTLFSCLRTRVRDVFEPRARFLKGEERENLFREETVWYRWLLQVYRVPESEILEKLGLDALMFLRFLRLACVFFGIVSVIGLVVIVPVNATDSDIIKGFEKLSMANMTDQSPMLWFHVASAYIFSILLCVFLWKENIKFISLRHDWQRRLVPENYSILVQSIPVEERSESGLRRFFEEKFGHHVHETVVLRDYTKEDKILAKREEVLAKLEHAMAVFAADGKRPQHKVKCCGCCGSKVDSIDEYTKQLNELNEEFKTSKRNEFQPNHGGFVTFNNPFTAQIAAQCLLWHNPSTWQVKAAPAPNDVYLPGVVIKPWHRLGRTVLVWVILVLLNMFWAIPVTFIAAITTLENLSKILVFLRPIVTWSPVAKGFLQGFLPTVALLAFMALLPQILWAIAKAEGIESTTAQENSVMRRYFTFQALNTFLVTTIAGSLLTVLNVIVNQPLEIVNLLGQSLPRQATFYVNFIMLAALSGFPLELLRPAALIVGMYKKKYVCKTEKELFAALNPGPMPYGVYSSNVMLVFLLATVYSTLAPIILPFALLFFSLAFVTYKHQIMHVYINKVDSGGLMWPKLTSRVIACLVIYQVSLIGLFGLKLAPIQAALTAPLPFLTIAYFMAFDRFFDKASKFLPLHNQGAEEDEVASLSASGKNYGSMDQSPHPTSALAFLDRAYVQTTMKAPDEVHPDLEEREAEARPDLEEGVPSPNSSTKSKEPLKDSFDASTSKAKGKERADAPTPDTKPKRAVRNETPSTSELGSAAPVPTERRAPSPSSSAPAPAAEGAAHDDGESESGFGADTPTTATTATPATEARPAPRSRARSRSKAEGAVSDDDSSFSTSMDQNESNRI